MKIPKPPPTPPQGATPNSKRRLKGQGVADRETKLVLTAEEKLGEHTTACFWLVRVAQSTTACIDVSRWAGCLDRRRCVAERQTKQIGQVVRNAIKSNRSLGGKTLKSIEGVFKAIDKDGSGDLDHNEFKMAMDRLGSG